MAALQLAQLVLVLVLVLVGAVETQAAPPAAPGRTVRPHSVAAAASATSASAKPILPPWPSPAPAFAASWFGGSLTAYEWTSPREMAALAKYRLVLTGWMELLTASNFTNGTAVAVAQATHLKAALGRDVAVFSYQSAWLAAAFYPEVRTLMDSLGEYRDFFLVGADKAVMNDTTYCSQTNTPPFPGCVSYLWNWCNASAVDYYIDKVLRPLVASPSGAGYAYDGVFLDNSDGFSTRSAINANCDAHNASMQVHIRTGKLFQAAGKWPVFSSTATGAGDALETEALWAAGVGYTRFIEFFAPTADAMANLYNETERGLPTLVHAPTGVKRHPPIGLLDSLAAFLVATGGSPYAYFQYSSGWYDNNWRWSPLFDTRYGVARGPPTITPYGPNMTGVTWTRQFSGGYTVAVDCKPPSAVPRFEWCHGNITNSTSGRPLALPAS